MNLRILPRQRHRMGRQLAWGTIFLAPNDSYWDRTPYAADIFFACWTVFAIGTACLTARLSRHRTKRPGA